MAKLYRTTLALLAGLMASAPALAQTDPATALPANLPPIESAYALPQDPLGRAESCAAYFTFGRAMAAAAKPQTEKEIAQAKEMEAWTVQMVSAAHRLGDAAKTPAGVNKDVQDKANQLSELTKDLKTHITTLGTNLALCRMEAPRIAAGSPFDDPQAAARMSPREEADALIASAQASDLFENLSRPDTNIVIRHKASGLVCLFNPHQPGNRLMVFPGSSRGDDIGCTTNGSAGTRSWYAKRSTGKTLDQEFEGYVREVKTLDGKLKPYEMPADIAASPLLKLLAAPKLPPYRIARFVDDKTYTSVTVSVINGWVIEHRYSLPVAGTKLAVTLVEPPGIAVELAQVAGLVPPVAPPKTATATAAAAP